MDEEGQGCQRNILVTIPEEHCAQAFITTDLDDNQITAFHPGAMNPFASHQGASE
jgi:adenosine kinase